MPVDHIGPRTLPDLLADRIAIHPDRRAFVFEDHAGTTTTLTYAELGDASARVAGGLAVHGIAPGDKIVVHMANRPEFVITLFALARLGAVAVPSNTALTTAELIHVTGWSDATIAITTPDLRDRFAEVRTEVRALEHVVVAGDDGDGDLPFAELLAAAPLGNDAPLDSEDPLEILFTSGTTSAPKGVVLTHANWLWSGERATHWLRLERPDQLLTALPLFHVNAQTFTLMAALTVGATAIFLEQYSASRFMDQVRRHEATCVSLVAVLVRTLLAQPASARDRDHSLRRANYAINVSTPEKEAFEQRFGVELLNGYGLSEAMTDVSVCPVFGPKRWPSIGQPAFGRELRLVDAQGAEVPTGEVGEITVRGVPGRTIMKEYYKDPIATASTIVDGWLHTGDNGWFDEHGYLYFFDRGKDMIKRSGENVSASEVELTLAAHPGVALAAVIGVPDPMRDESVMAFIVPRAGHSLSEEEITRHCTRRLAAFKVPTIIAFRDQLPLTSIGKVEKRQLRKLAAETCPA